MKMLANLTFFAIASSVVLPALAGPDWQAIEAARRHKQTQVAQTPQSAAADKCSDRRLVLPLDHGPRAQTTPYLNQQKRARFEAEMKACREAAGSGTRR